MKALIPISAIFCWLMAGAFAQQTAFVESGADWKYLADGTDQGTAWREVEFDDSEWPSGPSPLGFGEADQMTDIGREPIRITSYLRTEFEVSPAQLGRLARFTIEMRRDDGAIAYLNGSEIRRDNLPKGLISFDTGALEVVSGADETTYFESEHPPGGLVAGTNVLAVEIHNTLLESSDLMLDLRLTGDRTFGSFGGSRPPGTIDFETPEHPGSGVLRSFVPDYSGIDYSYRQTGTSGDVFRTVNEIFGPPLGTSVLAAYSAGFAFETLQVDVQNYTDVQLAFDLRVDGTIADLSNRIETSFTVTRQFGMVETLPWLEIRQSPPASDGIPLFPENAAIRYQVPTLQQPPIVEWIQRGFDDSGWSPGSLGIGYERSGNPGTYDPLLGTDVEAEMYNTNGSLNFRVPFTLSAKDLDGATELSLDMRYDDGFVAWLNGTEIARMNAPDPLQWNSEATTTHADLLALEYERFPVAGGAGLLQVGENVLAVRGLNVPRTSSDFLIQPRLLLGRIPVPGGDSLDFFRGEFKTVQTEPGFLGDELVAFALHIDAAVSSEDEPIFYLDNIRVTGTPIAADSFTTAVALEPGLDGIDVETNPDPEGDGLPLLLEYAFGGSFLGFDDSAALLPQVGYDELGFMTVRFRMLDGLMLGGVEHGYDVADLRYTPQLSYDLLNWRDGSGVPPFEQIGEILENGDGTRTVTLRSRRRLQEEQSRAYFRLRVEVARPPQVILQNGDL